MRIYSLLLLVLSFCCYGYAQTTHSLVSEVSLDSLVKTVREFSGEDSTTINDSTVRIVHRVSKRGNNLAADYLVARLKAYGLQVETIDYRNGGRNVVATLEGKTNPDSILYITAHYDAVADYCADDNASGSATVLEAARIMTQYCFHNTVKFAFWDEEERGLVGSRYYADSAYANKETILGVLNMDMMGYDGDSNKVFDIHTNSNPENQRLKDTLLFVLDTLNIDLVPNVINPGTTRSDHASFWRKGYPAVYCGESFLGGDPNPEYHTSKDRIDLFDLGYYHKLAQLAIGTIVELTGVIPTVVEHDTVSACYSYAYSDSTFLVSTVYNDSLKTAIGCDSIYTLHLTVLPIFHTTDTLQVCGKYVYRDTDFSISGVYHDTLTSNNGCDSIYTMNLTVSPILHVTDTVVVCKSYTYKGNTYELSGIYRDTFMSQDDCDSIYTIDLTVLPIYEVTDTINVCGQYEYRSQVFRSSGIYLDTLISRNGCDSIYTMDLTIRAIQQKRDTVFTCGDYTYRSRQYTRSGIYHDTLISKNGCDSLYTFDLRITRINDRVLLQTNSLTAVDTTTTYQWMTCKTDGIYQNINGATNRSYTLPIDDWYAVALTKNQCEDTSDCIQVTLSGIEDIQRAQFNVYPNPTNGLLIIRNTEFDEALIVEVFAMNGSKLKNYQFKAKESMSLRMPDQTGLYIVKVQSSTHTEIYKILKTE